MNGAPEGYALWGAVHSGEDQGTRGNGKEPETGTPDHYLATGGDVSEKKRGIYYEVWSDHPASWLAGKLVVNREQLEEILRKARAEWERVSYRVKE